MHSCLTLVDYTWKDSDESGTVTPRHSKITNAYRLKRLARSLDRKLSNSLDDDCESLEASNCPSASTSTSKLHNSVRNYSSNVRHKSVKKLNSNRNQSPFLLHHRILPIYATTRRITKEPDLVWVPVGHCRYLLERDLITGEIKWTPESNELICSPRCLVEICMARLIRDWPCTSPPRRSSLHNMASFLFNSKDLQTNTNQRHALKTSHQTIPFGESENKQNNATSSIYVAPPTCHDLPLTLLTNLLSEAIIQRDCAAITGIVANWPGEHLNIGQLIPKEEYPLTPNYMTKPLFVLVSSDGELGHNKGLVKGLSLLDAFILGFLSRQSACKLKTIDFTGFENDSRISIELCRLPILWMKPESRNSETVRRHLMSSFHIGIPQKRLEAYFGKIATIYAYHEAEIGHGEPFETVTIHLECNMTVDEVALGLSLQTLTPFRFSCNRLLLQRIPEIYFPPYSLIRLFDPLTITQFELQDPTLGSSLAVVLPSAVGWLISLRNLRACSLPSCIPPPPDVSVSTNNNNIIINNNNNNNNNNSNSSNSSSNNNAPSQTSINSGQPSAPNFNNNIMQQPTTPIFTSTVAACRLLNRSLISLRYLQRLGLAQCHLTGQLKTLLHGLSQPLEYLNLQDCCLSPDDIHYLVHQWRPLVGLYELNLSRNNFSIVPDETLYQLIQKICFKPQGHLMCLSIAYTCLSTDRIIWLLSLMAGMDTSRSLEESIQRTIRCQMEQEQQSDEDNHEETKTNSDKWMYQVCTLRVLCIQSFIPPACDQIHRILYRVTKLRKLHELHLFPAFYAFPAPNEASQREMRSKAIHTSKNYMQQRSRADIEIL